MLALSLLDLALLAVATVIVGRTFGARTAVLQVALFGSFYFMAHAHLKGAFLRTDFAVALVLATCALAAGRAALAGLLVAWATTSRLFPAVFLLGPATLAAWELLSGDRARVRAAASWALRLLGAWGAGTALLVSLSIADTGGLDAWRSFAGKIAEHRRIPHIWNVGLDALVVADFSGRSTIGLPPGEATSSPAAPALLPFPGKIRTGIGFAVRLAALAAFAFAVRRLAPHRALALGFVPLFVLVAPTYYYYVVIALPFLFFAERAERPAHAAGLALLYVWGAAGFALYARWDQYFPTTFWCSAIGLAVAIHMIALALAGDQRAPSRLRANRLAS
jgi:hypothetical protein